MITYLLTYLATLPSGVSCYTTQFRAVASGFLGDGTSVTSFNKQKSDGTIHYLWLPDGTDVVQLATQHPTVWLEMKDGTPTGSYKSDAEYNADSTEDSANVGVSAQLQKIFNALGEVPSSPIALECE